MPGTSTGTLGVVAGTSSLAVPGTSTGTFGVVAGTSSLAVPGTSTGTFGVVAGTSSLAVPGTSTGTLGVTLVGDTFATSTGPAFGAHPLAASYSPQPQMELGSRW